MQKILLYYKFVPLADPTAVRLWQRTLCEQLNLKGRILISPKGVNGTVGGGLDALKAYARATRAYLPFKDMEFKWSDGGRDDFPKLSVKVRDETVTLGLSDGIAVDECGVIGGGTYIKPTELDAFMAEHPDAVLFDGRNKYESAIGRFKDAITPQVETFKELPAELDRAEYEQLKDRKIVTYCTGGIRCETLSALMKQKGFSQVYQLHGGIIKYGEAHKGGGLWEGSCFVFDRRMSIGFSDQATDIGECEHCRAKTSNYVNCEVQTCNKLMLLCAACTNKRSCGTCQLVHQPV